MLNVFWIGKKRKSSAFTIHKVSATFYVNKANTVDRKRKKCEIECH